MSGLLDLDIRRRLYALIREYPGLHVREAARQLDTSVALVEYHVAILRQNGLLREERDERYVRLYPLPAEGPPAAASSPAERRALALLRQRLPLRITLYLLDQDGPVQHKALCEALEMGKSKLSFHLRKLEAAKIVAKNAQGRFEVRERSRWLGLLLTHKPTPELREAFADLWLSLYGKKA
jgi:predicted transcriptional regulator